MSITNDKGLSGEEVIRFTVIHPTANWSFMTGGRAVLMGILEINSIGISSDDVIR